MIVLDENIQHERLIHAIAAWYPGRVIAITDLRPEILIKNEIPDLLRRVLRLPAFRTKSIRMGKVIHVMPTYIESYAADRQIHRLVWPD